MVRALAESWNSRQDAFFGDPNPFNQTIFDETLAQWTEDTISVNTSAKGRAARIRTSNATNPEFSLSRLAQAFTTGESVAFIMVFGDVQTGVAPKAPVQFFFGKFLPATMCLEPRRNHSKILMCMQQQRMSNFLQVMYRRPTW